MPWSTAQAHDRATRYQHTAIAANATNTSEALDVTGFQQMSIQVVHAAHTDTSTFDLQSTNDGTNWDAIAGTSTTTAGAAESDTLVLNPIAFRQIRLRITEADGSATATLTPFITANKWS